MPKYFSSLARNSKNYDIIQSMLIIYILKDLKGCLKSINYTVSFTIQQQI
jgi:hypothetical protein